MNQLQPGQTIGPYRIEGQIGMGGMATVYKAYHSTMDRYVALKVLPRQLAESDEFSERFRQEARLVANLEHPHILPVYDYGEANSVAYFVMRLLEGGTLKQKLKAGLLPLSEVDRLFTQLAGALAYAHARQVVHRDLKPSNAMIDAHGNLFLTDFGIAKLLEANRKLTATGAMMGTPDYMSPEQARGLPVDQRSDIYSLGIILYEMVTGRVPFEAETPLAVVLKHIQEPLPLPTSINPQLSMHIEQVLLRALEKDPAHRFATANDFVDAWKRALANQPTLPPQPALTLPPQPAPSPSQAPAPAPRPRQPLLWVGGAVGLVSLCLCGLLAVAVLNNVRNNASLEPTRTSPPMAVATDDPSILTGPLEPTAPATASPQAQSWAAASLITGLDVFEDKLYAAGPGGLTVWDAANGTLLAQYTTADGIPSATISTVRVDQRNGTVWLGTDRGVGHFDPANERWVTYDQNDGLNSTNIRALAFADERLWVATGYGGPGTGLMFFENNRWSTVAIPSADDDPQALSPQVNALWVESTGVWVGTENGLGWYDLASASWTRLSEADGLPSPVILSLHRAADGTLWIGTSSGAARLPATAQTWTLVTETSAPAEAIYAIASEANGRVWLVGNDGARRFDPANGNWDTFNQNSGQVAEYALTAITVSDAGNVYLGGAFTGLYAVNGNRFDRWAMPNGPYASALGRILPAPSTQLWFVAQYATSVSRFNWQNDTWLPLVNVCSCDPLGFDPAGRLWGSLYAAPPIIQPASGQATSLEAADWPAEATASAIAFGDEQVWLGTQDHGLMLVENDRITARFTAEAGHLPANTVRALWLTEDGVLWVATEDGLAALENEVWTIFGRGNPFPSFGGSAWAHDIAQTSDGTLWVAAPENGLYRWQDDTWTLFDRTNSPLNTTAVWAVYVDAADQVWLGTSNQGAWRLAPDGTWTNFNLDSGLINADVLDIFVDDTGAVWFATAGGVTRLR